MARNLLRTQKVLALGQAWPGRMNQLLMKTYRLHARGRRATLLIALGALIVWLFALWKLPDVLGLSYSNLPGTFRTAWEQGFTVSQIVPALLLIVLIIAAPLLVWNLAEEWSTTYTVREDGLLYDTVQGITVLYPWATIKGVRLVDPEEREPVHEVIVDQDGICQIRSRILRWLHQQAFGRTRVPIYAQVVDRDELLYEIRARAGLQPSAQPEHGTHTHS